MSMRVKMTTVMTMVMMVIMMMRRSGEESCAAGIADDMYWQQLCRSIAACTTMISSMVNSPPGIRQEDKEDAIR